MPRKRTRLRVGLVGVALACLTLTGCSKDVSQGDVEDEITRVYEDGGSTIEDVSCEGSLKGEVGATQDCTATIDGEETDLVATVSKVDGSTVNFNIEPADSSETPSGDPTEEPTDEPSE